MYTFKPIQIVWEQVKSKKAIQYCMCTNYSFKVPYSTLFYQKVLVVIAPSEVDC